MEASRTLKILLIDDREPVGHFVQIVLSEDEGHETAIARSFEEAERHLPGSAFDLVLISHCLLADQAEAGLRLINQLKNELSETILALWDPCPFKKSFIHWCLEPEYECDLDFELENLKNFIKQYFPPQKPEK